LFRRFFRTHNATTPFKTHNSYWRLRSTGSIASVQARSCWTMAEQVAGLNTGDRTLVGLRSSFHSFRFGSHRINRMVSAIAIFRQPSLNGVPAPLAILVFGVGPVPTVFVVRDYSVDSFTNLRTSIIAFSGKVE
jgi:hypothetical protein